MNRDTEIGLRYKLERQDFTMDVAATIPLQGVTGIFGPSGAGKTTLLRCIAGLEETAHGELTVGTESWEGPAGALPVHRRQIGYVFQEPRLFSHLRVSDNIRYGLRRSPRAAESEVAGVIDLLGLGHLLSRWPRELSGGEAQRVAIARALVRAPRFVLMDEPLAALDATRKLEILPFLDRLHAESAIPLVYVSHNIDEISRLCDHLIILDQGQVAASGDLQSVLVQVDVPALAGSDAAAVIYGTLAAYDKEYELTRMDFSGGFLWLPGALGDIGDALRLMIRANDVSLSRQRPVGTSILNTLEVVIEGIQEVRGPTQLVTLAAGSERLVARVTRRSIAELQLQVGESLIAQVKAAAVRSPVTTARRSGHADHA